MAKLCFCDEFSEEVGEVISIVQHKKMLTTIFEWHHHNHNL